MLMPIAQLALDTVPAFVTFVVGGSAALFLVNQALTFYKEHIKERPAPADTYATKTELSRVENQLRESIGELADDLKDEVGAQAGKRKRIYESIEKLGQDMAAMKSDNTAQTRQLVNLEAKVDRLLERSTR